MTGVWRQGPHVSDGIKVRRKAPGFLKALRCYPTGPRIVHHWTSSTYERNTLISYLSHCYFAVLLNRTLLLMYTSRLYYLIAFKNKKVTLKHTIFPYKITIMCSHILLLTSCSLFCIVCYVQCPLIFNVCSAPPMSPSDALWDIMYPDVADRLLLEFCLHHLEELYKSVIWMLVL